MNEFETEKYLLAKRTIETKINLGIRPHTKRIPCYSGMKEFVKMYRWTEFDTVMELKSEPFMTLEEALHFVDCFNDNFLYDAYCVNEQSRYYVYSGWILKSSFMAYCKRSKNAYYEFANWS